MAYVLVLGAKSDIGLALAHRYAHGGYDVYLAARDHETLEKDAADIRVRYRVEAKPVEFDVLDFESHEDFYNGLLPRPRGVISVVGLMGDHEKAKSDFEEARRIIDTNYTGCVSILNIAANDFENLGEGFIIGISSVAGDRGRQSNYYYGSAKGGFTAYLSGLRNRLFKAGVYVLTVKPGFVATKMTEKMDLPSALTAQPRDVAEDVFRAHGKGKDIIYTKWFWRPIMHAVIHTPEKIFKRLKL